MCNDAAVVIKLETFVHRSGSIENQAQVYIDGVDPENNNSREYHDVFRHTFDVESFVETIEMAKAIWVFGNVPLNQINSNDWDMYLTRQFQPVVQPDAWEMLPGMMGAF